MYFQVFLYLRSVLLKILPRQLVWGSSQNERTFYMKVKYLISLRRCDRVCAGYLCEGINIMEIPWLSSLLMLYYNNFKMQYLKIKNHRIFDLNLDDNDSKHLLCKFVAWVFMDLIFILIKKFFYVTDHADYRNRYVFIYWAQYIYNDSTGCNQIYFVDNFSIILLCDV